MVQTLTEQKEVDDVIQNYKFAMIDFFATWCGPCRAIAPQIDAIEADYEGAVKFAKVDVDESAAIAHKYEITAMPTFIFFENGEISKTILGANFGSIQNTLADLKKKASE